MHITHIIWKCQQKLSPRTNEILNGLRVKENSIDDSIKFSSFLLERKCFRSFRILFDLLRHWRMKWKSFTQFPLFNICIRRRLFFFFGRINSTDHSQVIKSASFGVILPLFNTDIFQLKKREGKNCLTLQQTALRIVFDCIQFYSNIRFPFDSYHNSFRPAGICNL